VVKTSRISRLLHLIQALQSGRPYTVEELGAVTGVNRRTVFRDLKLLNEAGICYDYDRAAGQYASSGANCLPPVSLTTAEAMALLLATRKFLASRVAPNHQAASAAAIKIESMIPRTLIDFCGPLLEHVEVGPEKVSDPHSITDALHALQASLARRRKMWVQYDSYHDSRLVEDVLSPYRLLHMHRGWYVIAHSQRNDELRTYKIERFAQFRLTDDPYRMDDSFTLDGYFGNAWSMIRGDTRYHVRIRFLPRVAGNVDEVTWHRTQRTTHEEGGSLLFEVDVDGLDEISWWVLGYGDQAVVLDPPELRTIIRQQAAGMAAHYAAEP
jgi:proteasome accessory factor B